MKTRMALVLSVLFLGGCQAASGDSLDTPTSMRVSPSTTATGDGAGPTAARSPAAATATADADALAAFTLDLSQPFSDVELTEWTPESYNGEGYTLPLSSSGLANPQVIGGLTGAQRSHLMQNGFVIIHSREEQFADIRQSVNTGQPYFLTVDAAYHALHQNFDDLLKAAEKSYFGPRMQAVLEVVLNEILSHSAEWKGTALEEDGSLAVAYLSVALKLFDPEFAADPSVRELVDAQVGRILEGGGWDDSPVEPSFKDDYGAYKPVGHYAGDPELENYFRGMTWLGRMHFDFDEPSLLPLIVTLALRRSELDGRPASEEWAEMNRVLDFIVGPSDDMGPLEYAALMDEVFGSVQTYAMLADTSKTNDFFSRGDELPEPQINSKLVLATDDTVIEKGWRFMGQRFTIDAFVFQNLMVDRVGERKLPTGLDVMAVFGSATARATLTEFGLDDYGDYDSQFAMLFEAVQSQPKAEWTNRFYTAWLYSFFPLLGPKGEPFPPFMSTAAWGYKDMNAGLGSWAELKHDTVLYAKMPESLGGGGPPSSGPAPAYVEPNPNAFYRMAYAARSLARGLKDVPFENISRNPQDPDMGFLLMEIGMLGDRLEKLGDIAVMEIKGEPIAEEYGYIWWCLGRVECKVEESSHGSNPDEPPEVPVVAAVAGYTDYTTSILLEVGVGYVDRIYVVVPIEGRLEIAQGGVFSYYEFIQPRENRLTDQEWRAQLLSASPPSLPPWSEKFVLQGGKPVRWTAFRIGDVYLVTEAGDLVRVRANPSAAADVLAELPAGSYITILDGPVQADGYTWWKISDFFSDAEGWVAEDQEWYIRV
jgi:hypothetical protein